MSLLIQPHRLAVSCLVACLLIGCNSKRNGPELDTGNKATNQTLKSGESPDSPVVKKVPLPVDIWVQDQSPIWTPIVELEAEAKFASALKATQTLLSQLHKSGASQDVVRGLLRQSRLQSQLDSQETALRSLAMAKWPKELRSQTALHLHLANAFGNYLNRYRWEISSREHVVSSDQLDLKKWTKAQILDESNQRYFQVWQHRAALGNLSKTSLFDVLAPGNFPKEVRGTLRDAVIYMWATEISNTTTWQPQQESQTHQLDLESLLIDAPPSVDPSDRTVHPISRVSWLLAEHEAWHLKNGRRAAALEAFLMRINQLHSRFENRASRAQIFAVLKQRLAQDKDLEWWTMGMSLLADFQHSDDAPGALITAHRTASDCMSKHVDSQGAKKCAALVSRIEQPEWSVQSMKSDDVQKRSIRLSYKNLTQVRFSAWRIDAQSRALNNQRSLFNRGVKTLLDYVKDELLDTKPSYTWTVSLASTRDYKTHTQHVRTEIKDRGDYVIVAHRNDLNHDETMKLTQMNVSNLVASYRVEDSKAVFRVNRGDTGGPLEKAKVRFYRINNYQGGTPRLVATQYTDVLGQTTFVPPSISGQQPGYFAIIDHPTEGTLIHESFYVGRNRNRRRSTGGVYVFTDRSAYRPGQKVHWQLVTYARPITENEYRVIPNRKMSVVLRDGNNEAISTIDGVSNEFGTLSGTFEIPHGRILGQWRIQATGNRRFAQQFGGQVQVEAYKRPTFEISFLPNDGKARLNHPTTVTGEARYYFGLPVTAGKATWRVNRVPHYPWWWHWYGMPTRGEENIASGVSALDDSGQFKLTFVPKADSQLSTGKSRSITYRYTVSADVTDEGGETRSTSKSVHLGFVTIKAKLESDSAFERHDGDTTFTALRTDLDETPLAGESQWSLHPLIQPKYTPLPSQIPKPENGMPDPYRMTDDTLPARFDHGYQDHQRLVASWADGNAVQSGSLVHNKQGKASIELGRLKPGGYRLRYTSKDAFGALYETDKVFIVTGATTPLAVPVALMVDYDVRTVGETARLFVHSGFKDQFLVLTRWRKNKVMWRRIINQSAVLTIPIEAVDRGGIGFTLDFVRDHQVVVLRQKISVPWDNKSLDIRFSTFRDTLRPGQKETWSVDVKTQTGVPAVGEVLAYMHDRSLELFAPHRPPNPLNRHQPLTINFGRLHASVGQASYYALTQVPDELIVSPPRYRPTGLSIFGMSGLGFMGHGVGGGGAGGRMRTMGMISSRGGMRKMKESVLEMAEMEVSEEKRIKSDSIGMMGQGFGKEAPSKEAKRVTKKTSSNPAPIRSNFSETAFFKPQLLLDKNGRAKIRFQVPDSVTSWNVYVHAITKDLKYGLVKKQVKTIKDLMVRPYLPRFLREGDQAKLQVVVNNASDKPLSGRVDIDLIDPNTQKSRIADFGLTSADVSGLKFEAPVGKSARLSVPIKAPVDLGVIAIKVTASTDSFSDGELRSLPLLPGRMHLAQSRFAVLRDVVKKTLRFDDLAKNDDDSRIHESVVVTLDGQLFYGVLSALPYLVNYPYECTEQTLNRFVSTGILSSMYAEYPAVAKMAQSLAKRTTRVEDFSAPDSNRKITLEETPWLNEARGGGGEDLLNVLDPKVAQAHRRSALAKLQKSQLPDGGFPWFPGGRASSYMTLYLMYGFAKATEFGVSVPKSITARGWRYLSAYLEQSLKPCMRKKSCVHQVTFLNYILSMYPDPSWYGGVISDDMRGEMLDFSFSKWKAHSLHSKSQLALTLKRLGRADDARLVWDSVLDRAKETETEGTFWAPEDRSWLWYNDTIESHAMAIRTTMELNPKEPKLDGMILWLFLNKKLNHWKSTRATSEVIYALATYLKDTGQLGLREETRVQIGDVDKTFIFEPDVFSGKKNQIVIEGDAVKPTKHAKVSFDKKTKGYQLASATWHFSTEQLPTDAEGDFLTVTRSYFRRSKVGSEITLQPLEPGASVAVGDEVEVQLSITSKHALEYVQLRDPRAAGFEPTSSRSGHKWDMGIRWYEEVRDSSTNFFFERLPNGEYTFKYRLRATTEGLFKTGPAVIQPVYAPEFVGYSSGWTMNIGASTTP